MSVEVISPVHSRSVGSMNIRFESIKRSKFGHAGLTKVWCIQVTNGPEVGQQDFDTAEEAYATYVGLIRGAGDSSFIPALHDLVPDTLPSTDGQSEDAISRLIVKYLVKLTAVDHAGRMSSSAVQEMMEDEDFADNAEPILVKMEGVQSPAAAGIRVACKRVLRRRLFADNEEAKHIAAQDPEYGRF
jgi:hypothetical protein